MGGTCDHDFVFLIRCGAMACIECGACGSSNILYPYNPKY